MAKYRKLSKKRPHRRALINNLASSLLLHGRILTTEPRAKEIKRFVDKLITTANKDTLAARRKVNQRIINKQALKRLFTQIIKSLPDDLHSGYVKIQKVTARKGDGADRAVVSIQQQVKVETTTDKKMAKKVKQVNKK